MIPLIIHIGGNVIELRVLSQNFKAIAQFTNWRHKIKTSRGELERWKNDDVLRKGGAAEVIQFCFDSGMTPLNTLNWVKQDEYHLNVSQALVYKLFSRFHEGKSADERMGRLPLRNTGEGTEFDSVASKDRRQKVRYLAGRSGRGKPTVYMILKSDLKIAKTSAKCIPHLLLEDGCAHNHASCDCKLSDVLSNSNDVCRWARPIAGKMSAQTSLSDIFPSNFAW